MSEQKIDIRVPGAVWHDALDPLATEMEAAIGLDAFYSRTVKVGKGKSVLYDDVPFDIAEDLAEYLHDRGMTLWADDPESRSTLRACIETAAKIRKAVREAQS